MPATPKQRRYLEKKFGHAWVKAHHFTKTKPARKKTTPKRKRK